MIAILVSAVGVSLHSAPARSPEEPDSVLKFNTTLKSIYENINNGMEIPADCYYLLTGDGGFLPVFIAHSFKGID